MAVDGNIEILRDKNYSKTIKNKMIMKVRSLVFGMLCMLALGAGFASCSDDDDDDRREDTGSQVELPRVRAFILNEGAMGANNAGLAFYAPNKDADFISDIYKKQNNAQLGDTGNSMIEYEDEIYIAVNVSNRLVKLNAAGVEQKSVSFVDDNDLSGGIRSIDAEDGYIYASFWGGVVAKINAKTLEVADKLTGLGDNMEAVAICEDMLYVANSCTADYSMYHNEIKVIDLRTFKLKETLTTVAPNPYTQMLEEDDKVFFISVDYNSVDGYVLQMIDPKKNNQVTKIGYATYMAADNDVLYLINSITDWVAQTTVNTFFTYNIKTGQINNASFLKNAPAELSSITLHMFEVNDDNGDFYIGASDYKTNGTIYRFKKDGTFIEKFDAGGINPNSMVFFD